MTVPFVSRQPTAAELERFRLILSTFQDGTGQLVKGAVTLPGWRDFERAFALAFGGVAQEDKGLFDVRLPDPTRLGTFFGASCKMRGTLDDVARKHRATLELSNAAGEFWDELKAVGLDASNYLGDPAKSGGVILNLLERWRISEDLASGGVIDLAGSYYYSLQWSSRDESYQLMQFSMALPEASALRWYRPPSRVREGREIVARSLRADDDDGMILEWYGESGGQLKYYPPVAAAIWTSAVFHLEPLPKDLPHGIMVKAGQYFPELWSKTFEP